MQSDIATTERASPPVWHVEPQRLAIRERIAHVEDATGTLVAVVVDNLGEPGQAIRLAQLMAAAPQLLAVCARARHWAEQQAPSADGEGTFALIAAADHAIAAATGGQR